MSSNPLGAGTALITGASRGIGRAVAEQLAVLGMRVVLVARSKGDLADVVDGIAKAGGNAVACPLDLTQLAALPEQLAAIAAEHGPFQLLINNAGMAYTGDLANMPLADWQAVITLNLTAAFVCIQSVLPGMRAAGGGQIANVISIAGKQAFPNWGAYCASKFGLLGLSKSLAQEESKYGIRTIAFCPGSVDTPLWDTPTVDADFDRSQMLDIETVATTLVQALSLPHNAVVDELVLMPSGGTF